MLWRKNKSSNINRSDNPHSLDYPILWWTQQDDWTVRDACEGTFILGSIGSGKTSGSGSFIAKSFISAGYGGLVLTVKKDELDVWKKYCQFTGVPLDNLITMCPENKWHFNFLDYELSRTSRGGGFTQNLVSLFYEIMDAFDKGNGSTSARDPYWERAAKELLANSIELIRLSGEKLTIGLLDEIILSAPMSLEIIHSKDWQKFSTCFRLINESQIKHGYEGDANETFKYWLNRFPTLAEKTRSVVVSTFTSISNFLLRGVLNDMFCQDTNFTPELCHHGAIWVVDMPVELFGDVGRIAQIICKIMFQRAAKERDINNNDLPIFLWADEAQHFFVSQDIMFQSTARSTRTMSVYLTQNLPLVYMALGGGPQADNEARALLGNLKTKIFHQNDCTITNMYGAELISKGTTYRMSFGGQTRAGETGDSYNWQEIEDWLVKPQVFQSLQTGGPRNNNCVEGIVFVSGRTIGGNRYIKSVFKQV